MTIALGILAKDGIAIGADTQETVGPFKVPGRKIFTKVDPPGKRAISITGAGNAAYLDAAGQQIAALYERATTPDTAIESMSAGIADFHEKHVQPLQVLSQDERPDIRMLLGMTWPGYRPTLLASEHGAIYECRDFYAVGYGSHHAMALLQRIVPTKTDISLHLAGMLAAYTIFHVKQFVQDCGLGTHVTMIRGGNGEYFTEPTISAMEQCFRSYLMTEASMLNYVLCRETTGDPARDLAMRLDSLRGVIDRVAKSIHAEEWDLRWADEQRSPLRTGGWTDQIGGRAIMTRSLSSPKHRRVRQSIPQRSTRGQKVRPPSPE